MVPPPPLPLHAVMDTIKIGRAPRTYNDGYTYVLSLRKISSAFAYGECIRVILRMMEGLMVYNGSQRRKISMSGSDVGFHTVPGWKVAPDFWRCNIGFVHSLVFHKCDSLTDMDCHTLRTTHSLTFEYCDRLTGFGLLQLTRKGGHVNRLEIHECQGIADVDAFGRSSPDSRLFGCYPGDMTTVPLHTLIINEFYKGCRGEPLPLLPPHESHRMPAKSSNPYHSTLITDVSCLSNSTICNLFLIGCKGVKDVGSLVNYARVPTYKSCSIHSLSFRDMDL